MRQRRIGSPMKGSRSVKSGWKAYAKGDLAQAESEFEKATSENPEAAFAHLQQGQFRLRQERPDEAATCFETALTKEPLNPAPQFFLALARELQGEAASADRALENLAQSCPRHQGLASLRLLRELRRGDPVPVLAELGFGQKGASGESWQTLMAGLGVGDPKWLPPDLSSSQYLLGPILVEVEKRLLPLELPPLERRAGDISRQIDELKPPKRSLGEELRNFFRSLKGGPSLRKGQRLLAGAWSMEDGAAQKAQVREAIKNLRLGHQFDRFAFRNNYYLGEAYLLLAKAPTGQPYSRHPLKLAESRFLDSVRMDGANPYVLLYLALVEQNLGRPEAALECYRKATEKFTKLPEAHYGMGQCYLVLDQPREAREYLLRAVNSDLVLARERLNLFATLLKERGADGLSLPLPSLPPAPPTEALPGPSTEPPAEVAAEPEGQSPNDPALNPSPEPNSPQA